jgi:arginase family enzyme
LRKVASNLIKKKIIPIVIGGSQDLTFALYRSFDELEQMVNLVSIDSKFDFGKENDGLSASSYLTKIIIDEPNNLFIIAILVIRLITIHRKKLIWLKSCFLIAIDWRDYITLAEPIFRDADVVT